MAGVKGRLGAAEDLVRSKGREADTAARKLETGLLAAYNEVCMGTFDTQLYKVAMLPGLAPDQLMVPAKAMCPKSCCC